MDDFFDKILKMRKDGYVDDLPYPDMQAKPNKMREFLASLATLTTASVITLLVFISSLLRPCDIV